MHNKTEASPEKVSGITPHRQFSHWLIIGLLLFAALGVRLYQITRPPIEFAPIRQYQNAHIARGIYYETNIPASEEMREVARLNMERMGFVLEPRIIENSAVIGYNIAGQELLWIPRLLSALFWVSGGFILFLLAKEVMPVGAALFSTSFYLFLPYSIPASRSFQPDPLMVLMFLASIYTIFLHFKNPSAPKMLVAAAISSVAIVIKPYCLFPIWLVYFCLSIHERGLRKTVFNLEGPIFVFLSFIPSFFQYVYGIFTDVGFLQAHAHASFVPALIFKVKFWKGWLEMIGGVTGYLPFILAAAGFITTSRGRLKSLLTGLWTGYLFFGLSATYQMHTHSYYHMPFIPIAALSMGNLGANAVQASINKIRRLSRVSLAGILLLAISVAGAGLYAAPALSKHKDILKAGASILGVNHEFKEFLTGDYQREVDIAREIGELVGHSTNTVLLTPAFGRVIAYHGEFSGLPWPTSRSLYARKSRGTRAPDIKDDFGTDHITIGYQGNFIKYSPDFFIVTDFNELDNQPDLKTHLYENFPVLELNEHYVIFDMRNMYGSPH